MDEGALWGRGESRSSRMPSRTGF